MAVAHGSLIHLRDGLRAACGAEPSLNLLRINPKRVTCLACLAQAQRAAPRTKPGRAAVVIKKS
jgi:hypothetical protein